MATFGVADKIDSRLQERSKLIFEFPTTNSNSPLDRVCPFFENPMVSEKKSSNLIKYDVLGRSSNFLGYTGAKSRVFNVEFFMTLQHVVDMATNELFSQPPAPLSKLEQMKMFFALWEYENNGPNIENTYYRKRMAFLKKINDGMTKKESSELAKAASTEDRKFTTEEFVTSDFNLAEDLLAYHKDGLRGDALYPKALDIMLFWINLIRMSCLTSRRQPTLGPPVLRLTHGVLYERIATVLQNYSISMDEKAGYDMVTLIPNRIKISLSLLEIQRNHDPRLMTDVLHRDAVKGWDDLLIESHNNLDPLLWDNDYIYNID